MKDYIHNLDNDGLASETILYNIMDSHFIKEFINTEVEILEDNTEEIETIDDVIHLDSFVEVENDLTEVRKKINELVKAINQMRKDKSNDK